MVSQRNCVVITYAIMVFNLTCYGSSGSFKDHDSLDHYIYNYALGKIDKTDLGKPHHLSLPANLSGVEMSFSRIKASRIWKHGYTDSPYFSIPQWSFPWPTTKRIDVVYYNLGHLSKSFFDVPNRTFVAPTLGLLAYDSNAGPANHTPIELIMIRENSLIVRFHNVSLAKRNGAECVWFDKNGTLEFSNVMIVESVWSCVFRNIGHFSIVAPSDIGNNRSKGEGIIDKRRIVFYGIVGGGVLVSGSIVAVVVVVYLRWNRRMVDRRNESVSELSAALDMIWVGRNKIGVRT